MVLVTSTTLVSGSPGRHFRSGPTRVAKVQLEGGPWYLMGGGGTHIPSNFYAEIDKGAARRALKVAKRRPAKAFTPDGYAVIPTDQQELLEETPEGKELLKTLQRGLETTTYEIEEAARKRFARRWRLVRWANTIHSLFNDPSSESGKE